MKYRIVAVIGILFLSLTLYAQNDISFSDSEWNYGTVMQGEILKKELVISNNSEEALYLEIIPTCDCIYSQPAQAVISPNGKQAGYRYLYRKGVTLILFIGFMVILPCLYL